MALQKVDAVIAGVGAIALLATVMGVVFYEDLAGEQTIEFPSADRELAAQTGASGTPLNFALPNNATSGTLAVEVVFTGTSGQGGTANIQVDITGPDGLVASASGTMNVPAQPGTGASTTIDVPEFVWAMAPEPVVADPSSVDETMTWDEDLVVTVTVTPPDDALTAIPGGAVSYTFDATVTPTVSVFGAVTETPELENA